MDVLSGVIIVNVILDYEFINFYRFVLNLDLFDQLFCFVFDNIVVLGMIFYYVSLFVKRIFFLVLIYDYFFDILKEFQKVFVIWKS